MTARTLYVGQRKWLAQWRAYCSAIRACIIARASEEFLSLPEMFQRSHFSGNAALQQSDLLAYNGTRSIILTVLKVKAKELVCLQYSITSAVAAAADRCFLFGGILGVTPFSPSSRLPFLPARWISLIK
jgi:hypothetical protein